MISKQYFVNRQMYYYAEFDDTFAVEIADELDHAGAGMLGQKYGRLGDMGWYDDPREAALAATKIQEAWQQDRPDIKVNITAKSRFAWYLGEEPEPITRRELGQWAVKEWGQLPKCGACGKPGELNWGHEYNDYEGEFCSEYCADNDLYCIYQMMEEEDYE
jgi:hypothetical protein